MISLTIEDRLQATQKTRLQKLQNAHSLLFVPANQQKFIHSSIKRNADIVVLDLEDSIPTTDKPASRNTLQQHVNFLLQHSVQIAVRINQDLLNAAEDLRAAVIFGVDVIMVPKTLGANHLQLLDATISELELQQGLEPGTIKLIAMIETLGGLEQLNSLVHATPRLSALAMGSEDLSLDGGFEANTENLFYPAQQITLAAKRAGLLAYGFPGSIAQYSNTEQFTEQQHKGKSMGFSGALCIHPTQVDIVNRIYAVSENDIAEAKAIIDAYENALYQHQGAISVNGKMVDAPVVERARKILETSEQ